ncbi:MAG TPA: O-antigen ligase family protein [Phycisphaerae bacterium]|nr:O-antigen ligase family protein [Phycisphaerae bacterium]
MALVGLPFVTACALQPRVGLYAYFFWQAWDSAFVIGDSESAWLTPAKILAFLAMGTGILPLFKQNASLLASRGIVTSLLAFAVIAALSAVWSLDPARSGRIAAQMFVQLALLWVCVKLVSGDLAFIKRLFFWTFIGGLTAGGYAIVFGMKQTAYGRATIGDKANPGSVAAALVTGITCAPVLWVFVRRAWFRAFLFVGVLLIVLGVFATGSRAAVGGVGIGFVGAAVFSRSSALIGKVLIVTLMIGLAFGVAWASLNSGVLGEKSEARLANWLGVAPPSGVQAQGARVGRGEVWSIAWRGFTGTKGIGAGVGAAAQANFRYAGVYKDVHSNILGSLTEMGLPGIVTFVVLHALLIVGSWRMHLRALTGPAIVIFCGYFSFGATHTTYSTKLFWIPMTLMIILLEFDARLRASIGNPQ